MATTFSVETEKNYYPNPKTPVIFPKNLKNETSKHNRIP